MSTRIAEHKALSNWRGQTLSISTYSITLDYALQEGHDGTSSCFPIIHKSEFSSIKNSKSLLIQKFKVDSSNQDASNKLKIIGNTECSIIDLG